MGGGHDEWSSDEDPNPNNRKFKMPKRLRGFLFLERAQIPSKEHSGILNITQGLNIDRLKRVMTESFPDKVLKDIDGRSATNAPWQKSHRKKKPFHNKRTSSARMAEDYEDDEDEEDEEDANAADDDDYN